MENWRVYKHTFPNNKVYIGITKQTPKKRWMCGHGYKSNAYMINAIKKYGWNNIEHKILFENLTKEQAEQKEINLIAYYNSNNREFGYNIESGGLKNKTLSIETINKISAKNKGRTHILSSEAREKLRQAHIGKSLSQEHKNKLSIAHTGKKLSVEHIQKISKANKGKKHSEKTKKYLSMIKKGKPSKLKGTKKPQHIIDKIRNKNLGKKRTEEVKQQMRIRMTGKKMSESNKIKILNAKRRPVEMYSKDNILLKTYIDIKTAGVENNIHRGSITEVCKGNRKTAGGYIWRYKLKEVL